MPQDGSNNYQYPPGTPGIPDTTIESDAYNTFLDDLVTNDLNIPRPIHRGGTGATNGHDAMINLGGELTSQVVTNYDTFPFADGSFHSAAGATGAPSGSFFTGICYTYGDATNITLEARELTGIPATLGRKYVRQKTSTGWGAWQIQPGSSADLDTAYVNVGGDTMSGDLMMTRAGALTTGYTFYGNGGSAYVGFDGTKIVVNGNSAVNGTLGVSGKITANDIATTANAAIGGSVSAGYGAAASGTYYFGSNNTKYLTFDGTGFRLTGGSLLCSDEIWAGANGTTGVYRFGSTGTKALLCDGTNFSLGGGDLICSNNMVANNFEPKQSVQGGFGCKTGDSNVISSNWLNTYWTGSALNFYVDNSFIGSMVPSDYRAKKDVVGLPSMWATVKALRPIKYTHQNFTPPSQLKAQVQSAKDSGEPPKPFVVADNVERWGFLAHEMQEAMVPSAASGVKDDPAALQAPNPFTLIAALTKALQEAITRIEALETKF